MIETASKHAVRSLQEFLKLETAGGIAGWSHCGRDNETVLHTTRPGSVARNAGIYALEGGR